MRARKLASILTLALGSILACAGQPPIDEASPATPPPPAPDLVLLGGIVHTLDSQKPKATAIAVQAGRITAVGTDEELRALAGPKTRVIELEGKTVLPGLVDGHMHLASLGNASLTLDLGGTKSVKEIAEKLRAAAEKAEPGKWILGRGWDQNDWVAPGAKAPFPTAKDLDTAAPKNPVLLYRIDGHAAWVNSVALQQMALDGKTKEPEGGKVLKDARGRPTGVFIDNAIELVQRLVPPPTKEEVKATLLAGQALCLAAGLTQVHDMGEGALEVEALRELDEAGQLKLRVYGMLDGSSPELEAWLARGTRLPEGQRRYTLRGVKLFADGALGSRGASLFEPYADDPKNNGLLLTPPEVLESKIVAAKNAGFQVAIHAIGDRANGLVLDLYERVFMHDLTRHRPRIEHAQVLTLADIERLGRMGVIASMQPTHATSDMPWAEQRLGPARIKGAYAWQRVKAAGATLAAGSDAPVESIEPLAGLYAAIFRRDAAGEPKDGWRMEEALSPEEAVRAFSSGNAWASFRESEAGQVRAGFVADLSVLSKDPYAASAAELLETTVELTIVGGEVVFEKAPAAPTAQTPGVSPQSSL